MIDRSRSRGLCSTGSSISLSIVVLELAIGTRPESLLQLAFEFISNGSYQVHHDRYRLEQFMFKNRVGL